MYQNKVILALGTNIGNWKSNFNNCLIELSKIGLLEAIGNIYLSKPYGFNKQNNFYNTCVKIRTKFSPIQLFKKLELIEKKLFKKKLIKNGPRKIDIDIIFYNSIKFKTKKLTIPHKNLIFRDFVLLPLCDIDKFQIHPIEKKSIKKLNKECVERYVYKKIIQSKGSFVIY